MNKKYILHQLIIELQEEINDLKLSYERAKQASIDAPGRMQSRHDTTKVEAAWLANNFACALDKKMHDLMQTENINIINKSDKITVGCIVGLSNVSSDDIDYYFIIPCAGGHEICDNDIPISTITPKSPLGGVLIGKRLGDKIDIPNAKMRTVMIRCIE
jgi:transcription elongation GreA/GreB family factor